MPRLLKSIRNPRDLRQLSLKQLNQLAEELSLLIRDRFDLNDSYLRSACGMAELTVALHYVFDFSQDKVIFDLAHQAAAHMVLTRPELRESDKAGEEKPRNSAFPGDEKEPYDQLLSCHAGTSVSKAMGMSSEDSASQVVAVIGDGAVVSGIALEALNNGYGLEKKALIILNDNEMSVSKVVGAMGEYLSKIRAGQTYNEIKKDAQKLLGAIPLVGGSLEKAAEQLKGAIVKALVPGSIFEKLGPRYFGPVDGHNLAHLIQLLEEIKKQDGVRLLHLITRRDGGLAMRQENLDPLGQLAKGGDFASGERGNKSDFHEFERQGEDTYCAVFGRILMQQVERDPDLQIVSLVPPGLAGLGNLVTALKENFGDRVIDAVVNEQHGVAFAAGLAKSGKRVLVLGPAGAINRAYDQVFQDIALQGLPVVFALGFAGAVAARTGLFHGFRDIAIMRSMPGVDVMAPRDGRELETMLCWALSQSGPSAIRFPRSFCPSADRLYPEHAELVRGNFEVLRRGHDLICFALGSTVYPMMEAATSLAEKGIEATVVNARFVSPLDTEGYLKILEDYSLAFSIEEHGLASGFGSALLEMLAQERVEGKLLVPLAVPNAFSSRANRREVLRHAGLDSSGLADRVLHDYRRFIRGAKSSK